MDRRTQFLTIGKIMDRAEMLQACHVTKFDRLSVAMDLEYSNVDLSALLNADDTTFVHDFYGIISNMDRENMTLANCFMPRVGLNK